MEYKLDKWQSDVLATEGNVCLRSGRQVGKSFVIAIKAAEYAVKHPNKRIMVIASVERQAFLLFEKILAYMLDKHKYKIKMGKDKPTRHKINLTNKSIIYCFPTGLSGAGIRGFTIDLLIADEAAFIPEDVWTAVTPMLAVTKGKIILLSTPHGKEGFYYECFKRKDFTSFHVSSEDCPRRDDEFLAAERERMTEVQYAQEYLGEFIDELRQFFPDVLIKECMKEYQRIVGERYGGVDVARLGEDKTIITDGGFTANKVFQQDTVISGSKWRTTKTAAEILKQDRAYSYNKWGIDDAGVGGGVFDELLENDQIKRRIIGMSNATRKVDHKGRKQKLLKTDMYNHTKAGMEKGKVNLKDSPEVFQSFKSVQFELIDSGDKIRFFGKDTHIVEAFVRAYECTKSKGLNILAFC